MGDVTFVNVHFARTSGGGVRGMSVAGANEFDVTVLVRRGPRYWPLTECVRAAGRMGESTTDNALRALQTVNGM